MKYKIAVVTGTRAEYGILKPLLYKIKAHTMLELCLFVTGMHLERAYGETVEEIEKDGFSIAYRIPMNLTTGKAEDILASMGSELPQFGHALADCKPDIMVVLGDRYEIFMAAVAAMMSRIPIAHIHGGESTEGAVDESIRHAITKMSHLHFPAAEEYANRIIQMGEQPDTVYNVGSLGVENIRKCKLLMREELVQQFGPAFSGHYIMVTYHPVTLELCPAAVQFENLLQIIRHHPEYNYVFTYANADPQGSVINEMIEAFIRQNRNTAAFKSMGQIGYLSALQFAVMVLGNSSSGLIEAPSFGIPTVNIGDRQKGRIRAETVIDCGYEAEEIEAAFQIAVSDFAKKCKLAKNPYESENTSDKILEILMQKLTDGISLKKKFYDEV